MPKHFLSLSLNILTEMENIDNFITKMTDEINEKGVVVIDNIRRMPVYGEPYASPHYSIGINHQGSVVTEYDGKMANFAPHDIAIVYPNHTLLTHSSTDDYLATLIVVSEKLYNKLSILNAHSSRFWHEQVPHFNLTPNQYTDVLNLVESLRIATKLSPLWQGDLVLPQLHTLLQVISIFRIQNEGYTGPTDGHISSRFYDAIVKHYHEHHDVEFYASLFFLSPKYFSTSIKRETGHSANYWIQQHIIITAKTLLRTEEQYSLQEISERLGFPDLATFSRFFKRIAGITPSKYRQGNI